MHYIFVHKLQLHVCVFNEQCHWKNDVRYRNRLSCKIELNFRKYASLSTFDYTAYIKSLVPSLSLNIFILFVASIIYLKNNTTKKFYENNTIVNIILNTHK